MKKIKKISMLSVIVFICSVFWLMPLLLIFINSFKPYNDMLQKFLALPESWSLNMYMETWTKFRFPMLISWQGQRADCPRCALHSLSCQ